MIRSSQKCCRRAHAPSLVAKPDEGRRNLRMAQTAKKTKCYPSDLTDTHARSVGYGRLWICERDTSPLSEADASGLCFERIQARASNNEYQMLLWPRKRSDRENVDDHI